MTFLVISCPCALVISVPLTFFGGIGMASRNGILVRSGGDLEKLADTTVMVFDKTGTLTQGRFAVTELRPQGVSQETLLEMAAYAEGASNHPIARSILEAYGKPLDPSRIANQTEQAGHGVCAQVDGREILAGSRKLLLDRGVQGVPAQLEGTTVFVAQDGVYLGAVCCADQPKPEAKGTLQRLGQLGVSKLVMLTGDDSAVADRIGAQLGLTQTHGNLLPEDKLTRTEALLEEKSDGFLAFVGDGINDAPVLRRSDLGIAMGAMGSDAAIEAADVVLMDDNLENLPRAITIARRTMKIAKENIIFALGVKTLVMLLGALGLANMWMAVFADVGVAILAILNACRLMGKISK
jgi:Cd2+/Zn2+-exporting ATPase